MKVTTLALRKDIRKLTSEQQERFKTCVSNLNWALDNSMELLKSIPRSDDCNEIRDDIRTAQSLIRSVLNGFTTLGCVVGLFGGAVVGTKIGGCIGVGIGPWGVAAGAAIGAIAGLIVGGLVGSTLARVLILIIEKVRAIVIRIESSYTGVQVAATLG